MTNKEKVRLIDFLPGFVQGIVRVGISYPFDSVKTYMQKGIYRSTSSSILNIIKSDPKILYRGSSIAFLIIPTDRAVQYYYAEKLNKMYNPYFTGITLGFISSIYQLPLQYVCTNAVLTKRVDYQNIVKYIRSIKIRNVYRGYTVDLLRSTTAISVYLGTYLKLRNQFGSDKSVYVSPALGVAASIASWCITFPLDTIRTERQTTTHTLIEIIKNKYNTRGIRGFYSGLTPIIIRSIPSAAFGMLAYETTKKLVS